MRYFTKKTSKNFILIRPITSNPAQDQKRPCNVSAWNVHLEKIRNILRPTSHRTALTTDKVLEILCEDAKSFAGKPNTSNLCAAMPEFSTSQQRLLSLQCCTVLVYNVDSTM